MKGKLLVIIAAVLAVVLSACSSIEEPLSAGDESGQTRAGDVTPVRTYSAAEVRTFASRALNKKPLASLRATMTPVLATSKENLDKLLSDTVAYIVNYPNKGGFAVIANDSRVDPVLAYGDSVNFSMDNPVVKVAFLDRIEGYLASQNENGAAKDNLAPVRHIVIDPQITTALWPFEPYDEVIRENHPNHHSSFPIVAATYIITHALDNVTYAGYHYNFKSINYCLNQGYGYNPFTLDSEQLSLSPTLVFPPTYDGAVNAIGQLMYQIAVDSETQFMADGGTNTRPAKLPKIWKELGLTVSPSFDYSASKVLSLLNSGYLIHVSSFISKIDGSQPDNVLERYPISWVVDGCDLYLNANDEPISGAFHCVWGFFKECDGFYSLPALLYDSNEYDGIELIFGVGYMAGINDF